MFRIFHLSSVVSHPTLEIAPNGLSAIQERERLGLPPSPAGVVQVVVEENGLEDRRAAESWIEALSWNANLPDVSCQPSQIEDGDSYELADLYRAGLLVAAGPVSGRNDVALRLRLVVTPFELVCWRRAWDAARRARVAERKVRELEEKLAQLEEDEEDE